MKKVLSVKTFCVLISYIEAVYILTLSIYEVSLLIKAVDIKKRGTPHLAINNGYLTFNAKQTHFVDIEL